MTDVAGAVSPVLGGLVRELDRAAPTDLVEVCRTWVVQNLGVQECALLLADYSETTLEPVPGAERVMELPRLDVDGSAAGLAYRQQRAVHATVPTRGEAAPESTVTYLPVSMRTERLGVLAVITRATNETDLLVILNDVAQILAYVLTGARRYTDQFETLRRRRDLGLAAEIQWELLPVLAYELPRFSIAGALEPAYDIGGDTFDYAVSAQLLTVSITDAVGHGLRAAILSSLTVSAMRNTRRGGSTIVDQTRTANRHLTEQFGHAEFVTGLILQLEVATGHGFIINAGHPPPLLLRDGAVNRNHFPDLLPPVTRHAVPTAAHRVATRRPATLPTDGPTRPATTSEGRSSGRTASPTCCVRRRDCPRSSLRPPPSREQWLITAPGRSPTTRPRSALTGIHAKHPETPHVRQGCVGPGRGSPDAGAEQGATLLSSCSEMANSAADPA